MILVLIFMNIGKSKPNMLKSISSPKTSPAASFFWSSEASGTSSVVPQPEPSGTTPGIPNAPTASRAYDAWWSSRQHASWVNAPYNSFFLGKWKIHSGSEPVQSCLIFKKRKGCQYFRRSKFGCYHGGEFHIFKHYQFPEGYPHQRSSKFNQFSRIAFNEKPQETPDLFCF